MNFSELDLLVFVEEFCARVLQGLSMDVCVWGGSLSDFGSRVILVSKNEFETKHGGTHN